MNPSEIRLAKNIFNGPIVSLKGLKNGVEELSIQQDEDTAFWPAQYAFMEKIVSFVTPASNETASGAGIAVNTGYQKGSVVVATPSTGVRKNYICKTTGYVGSAITTALTAATTCPNPGDTIKPGNTTVSLLTSAPTGTSLATAGTFYYSGSVCFLCTTTGNVSTPSYPTSPAIGDTYTSGTAVFQVVGQAEFEYIDTFEKCKIGTECLVLTVTSGVVSAAALYLKVGSSGDDQWKPYTLGTGI